jgi:hypothetical protein
MLISASEMDSFLKYVDSKSFIIGQQDIFPKYILKPYEMIFGKQHRMPFYSTNKTLEVAKHNLNTHFTAVGYLV